MVVLVVVVVVVVVVEMSPSTPSLASVGVRVPASVSTRRRTHRFEAPLRFSRFLDICAATRWRVTQLSVAVDTHSLT